MDPWADNMGLPTEQSLVLEKESPLDNFSLKRLKNQFCLHSIASVSLSIVLSIVLRPLKDIKALISL